MKKKRILSWLLAIAIVISSLPISALLPAKTVLAADLTVVAPNDATVVAGNTAEFTVEASGGTEPYTYQWEESTDSAATWNAIDGAISATYTIDSTTIEMDNYQYRCVVQDATEPVNTVTSDAALLRVNEVFAITTQPNNQTVDEGEMLYFAVKASGGTKPYSYQWQQSTDEGTSWTNIPAGTGSMYMIMSVTSEMDGNQYRCAVTDSASEPATVTSEIAILTLNTIVTEEPTYTITLTFDETKGSAEAEFIKNSSMMGTFFMSEWKLTAVADSGYVFAGWEKNPGSVNTSNPYSVTIYTNTEYKAIFEDENQVSFKFSEDGEEEIGWDLKSVVESVPGRVGTDIHYFEYVSGRIGDKDLTQLRAYINENSSDNVALIIDEGIENVEEFKHTFFTANITRLELRGLTTFTGTFLYSNEDTIATLWIPDVVTIGDGSSGAFTTAEIQTLYLPNVQEIKYGSFRGSVIGDLILPGAMPTVYNDYVFDETDITVWVPADKVDSYKTVEDEFPEDGLWYGCNVTALPDGVTDMQGLVDWAAGNIPDDPTVEDVDTIIQARELASALSLELYNGDCKTSVDKINEAYNSLGEIYATNFENMVANLPGKEAVSLDDEEAIKTAWNTYGNYDNIYKQYISAETVTKLNETYDRLNELLLQFYLQSDTSFVIKINDRFVYAGETVDSVLPKNEEYENLFETIDKIEIIKGTYNQHYIQKLWMATASSLVIDEDATIASGEVSGALPPNFLAVGQTSKYFEAQGVKYIQEQAFTSSFGGGCTLVLPDAAYLGKHVYYNKNDISTAAVYHAFMPKLMESSSRMTSDETFVFPRLAVGRYIYWLSDEQAVFLPSLKIAGESIFQDAQTQAVWMPNLKTIDAHAFNGAAITELYLGDTPPIVTDESAFDGLPEERTVYVPDDAVNIYKASGNGTEWNGFSIKAISTSEHAVGFINDLINDLPENEDLTVLYAEWLGSISSIIDTLSLDQKAQVNMEVFESAIDAIATLQNTDIDNVIDLIDDIDATSAITTDDKAVIVGARNAYDALYWIFRSKVTNYDKLEIAEIVLEGELVADIISRINALPNEITKDNKDNVRNIYSDFLDLSDEAREDVTNQDLLMDKLDNVIEIEKNILAASAIDERISALPDTDNIGFGHKKTIAAIRSDYENLNDVAKNLVQNLAVLELAEAKIVTLLGGENDKIVYVSIEKFTLGQGYAQTPIAVTVEPGENVAQIITELLGSGNYENTGTVDNSFYLAAIKDNDNTEVNVPQYILDALTAAAGSLGDRQTENWLGEFDYYGMSGWMYTVNDSMTNLGASEYDYEILNDGDVIRWQYTVYGHGADLGFDSQSGGNKLIETANKDALTAQIAIVNASSEKIAWFTDEDYAQVYEDALAIAADMCSTQAEVDVITQQLADTPQINTVGTVTVIVKDTVPRRQYLGFGSSVSDENYNALTGLDAYQKSFGMIMEAYDVAITADMTAEDVVVNLLKANGYTVQTTSKGIVSIGPVASEDKSRTVQQLGKDDVGELSKWVLSLNTQAIYDSATYEFYPKNGDTITLEYSVDGGYDVGCYFNAGINYDLQMSVDFVKVEEGVETRYPTSSYHSYVYLPHGTTEYTYEQAVHIAVEGEYEDKINRYNIFTLEINGVEIEPGEVITYEEGQTILTYVTVPQGAGILTDSYVTYNKNTIVRVMKDASDITALVNELPDPSSIQSEDEEQYFHDYYDKVNELKQYYDAMFEDEKGEVDTAVAEKLEDSYVAVNAIGASIKDSLQGYYNAIRALPYANNLSLGNFTLYESDIASVRTMLDSFSVYKKEFAIASSGFIYDEAVSYAHYDNFIACEEKIAELKLGGKDRIGIPTDYSDDMIISNNAFNLDLDADEYAYEVVFKDWPRVANSAPIHIDGLLTFDIEDPEIFEIVAVPATWIDLGLGGGNKEYDTIKYYLVPKQAGTTTFTVDFDAYGGRVPEMTVHVNDVDESSIDDLENNLTDINSQDKTRKYDTFYYWEGEEGAPFTFHVNGDDPTVYVYDYLQYDDETGEATKTGYTVDSDGNVTVLLKDGYNGIEVSSTYQGQDVTQVYGLKGKVIKYEITNETRPESETYQVGDTISINIVGLDTPVKKISRIYNPSAQAYRYDVNMPRQFTVQSGGGQYTISTMTVELTGSGDITLSNGRIFEDWFGSSLYSETAQGNDGSIAPQSQTEFSTLPDITVHVQENQDYDPDIVSVLLDKTKVQPGETVTLTIPNLDTQYIANNHISTATVTNDILNVFTAYNTDIPGLSLITSEEVAGKTNLNALKTITFTVPENIAPGEYRIFGGYVDMTYGIGWWKKYTTYYESTLDDCVLTIVETDLGEAKTNAISELEGYADPSDYDLAGQTALTEAIESGTDAINAAMTIEDVNTALSTAKAVIDQIPYQMIPAGLSEMYEDTGAWLSENVTNPSVGSTGGEWSTIGLARSGYPVSDDYYDTYLSNVNTTASDKDGNLNSNKYTEYSRVILAMTAIGGDVTDIAGYNFLEKLADFDKIKFQGINGPIFALIALDSNNYAIPTVKGVSTQTSREMLIDYILDAHLDDGGWNLSSSFTGESDPDMTAMALQALAPYYLDKNKFEALGSEYSYNKLKAIVDEALETLSKLQADDGTFGSQFGGGQSSESTSQVIVALTALKIDPTQDTRFIKNDNDPIEALMTFYVDGGGFKHLLSGSRDGMATEQGYYALTAYYRFIEGETSLYDMSDVVFLDDNEKADRVIDLIDAIGTVTLDGDTAINNAITAYNALNSKQKALVSNYATLQSAIAKLSTLKVAECERLIDAIGTVTLDKEDTIVKARTYYTSLSDEEQKKVDNYDKLTAAEEALKELKKDKSEPTDNPEPTGSTKSVTVTIKNIEYEVSEATASSIEKIDVLLNPEEGQEVLPEDFSELTEEQVEDILSAYRAYMALTDDEKLFVENYEEFEAVLEKLGEEFHYDNESGVDVRGNEVLPWNVKINVQPQTVSDEQLTAIRETLGEEADMMLLCDIHFTDMITGNEYEPDAPITVKISIGDIDIEAYETLVIVHITDDGTL